MEISCIKQALIKLLPTKIKNHSTLFKYMLDKIDEDLTEDMIKKNHYILEKEWYKKISIQIYYGYILVLVNKTTTV